MGVKDIRILVDHENVFEGKVEKGCGNHVFDYVYNIPVNEEESPPSSASAATITPSTPAMDNVSLFQSTDYTKKTEDKESVRKSSSGDCAEKEQKNLPRGNSVYNTLYTYTCAL